MKYPILSCVYLIIFALCIGSTVNANTTYTYDDNLNDTIHNKNHTTAWDTYDIAIFIDMSNISLVYRTDINSVDIIFSFTQPIMTELDPNNNTIASIKYHGFLSIEYDCIFDGCTGRYFSFDYILNRTGSYSSTMLDGTNAGEIRGTPLTYSIFENEITFSIDFPSSEYGDIFEYEYGYMSYSFSSTLKLSWLDYFQDELGISFNIDKPKLFELPYPLSGVISLSLLLILRKKTYLF